MFKLAFANANLFKWLSRYPFLSRFISFRIDCLQNLHDPALASSLFEKIYTSDGTSKQTAPGRFRDLDLSTVGLLTPEANLIHDVAVSSGITSVELHSVLRARHIPFELFVSDKFSRFLYRGSMVRRIYDANNTLLCAYVLWILADWKCNWKFPISKLLFLLVKASDKSSAPFGELHLFDFQLLELIRKGDVNQLNYDIFSTSMPDRFTFVRCMNVLNLSYFKPEAISLALSLLKRSLKDQGVLLLGKTLPDGANAVSFYRKVSGNFELIRDLNGGSEISHLMDSIRV